MNFVALVFALAVTNLAGDELVLRGPGLHLHLTSEACTNEKVLAGIGAKWQDVFRTASLKLDAEDVNACWIDEGESVTIAMEGGGFAQFPKSIFTRQRRS